MVLASEILKSLNFTIDWDDAIIIALMERLGIEKYT